MTTANKPLRTKDCKFVDDSGNCATCGKHINEHVSERCKKCGTLLLHTGYAKNVLSSYVLISGNYPKKAVLAYCDDCGDVFRGELADNLIHEWDEENRYNKIPDTYILKPCCSSPDLRFIKPLPSDYANDDDHDYAVKCYHCEERGPVTQGKENAVRHWNFHVPHISDQEAFKDLLDHLEGDKPT